MISGEPAERPWLQLIVAAARMGVPPEAFWRLSVVEWRALAGRNGTALSRRRLQELSERFPDHNNS